MSRKKGFTDNFVKLEIEGLTKGQKEYLQLLESQDVVISVGPAGTGKSYMALSYAARALYEKQYRKLIITRPAIEAADEKLGALPGELDNKFAPYLEPCADTLIERLGSGLYECYVKNGTITPIPVGFLRGRSLDNCIIICDEAQNLNPAAMLMLLTRIGKYSKLLINGDIRQKDIKKDSGLITAMDRLSNVTGIGFIELTNEDIVRSDLVKRILLAWEK